MAKLLVTSRGFYHVRWTAGALRRALPEATVRGTGFAAIFVVEAEGDAAELAKRVHRDCAPHIGRAAAVLAEVPTELDPIREAALRVGREQVGEDESFCFRLHKRGAHGLPQHTPKLEYEIGGAIWVALRERSGRRPKVDLVEPDVKVVADVLGPVTAVGIERKAWRSGEPDSHRESGNPMRGWIVPPAKRPEKSPEVLSAEREEKVCSLARRGYLRSDRIRLAMLRVPREGFVPDAYRDYAYEEVPLPLPGVRATISCPHSYPLFYEPLGLDEGHRFLEVGLGSGYGTALAREIVGDEGLVVSVEIDPLTLAFARGNLERAGYRDIVLALGDGGFGWPQRAPYDRICVTAACEAIPSPLVDQLRPGGRLIAPVVERGVQNLTLLEKRDGVIESRVICQVLYVPLRGRYAYSADQTSGSS